LAAASRSLSSKCRDAAQVRRILPPAMVREGRPRTEAAKLIGMDRQTLRERVRRYSEAEVEGLKLLTLS
jgi:DNA-binding NtrC family response regulator